MLAYILAIAVGLASLSLYLSAFFLPELHRKDDFLWSGVGLFYALVLWVCAGRMTGGVLLGQSAAVSLLLCFGWQTLRLRRAIAHPDDKTDVSGFSLLTWVQNRFQKPSPSVIATPEVEEITSQEEVIAPPETAEEETPIISEVEPEETPQEETPIISQVETEETPQEETPIISEVETEETPQEETPIISEVETEETPQEAIEEITEDAPPANVTETSQSKKQGFSLKSIFGLGKSQPQSTPEAPESDLEESNWDDDNDVLEKEEVTSTLVEETDTISSETTTETSEIKAEETIETENFEISENLQEYVAEFEPYLADDDAETLIEDHKPKTEESQSEKTDDIDTETSKTEDKN